MPYRPGIISNGEDYVGELAGLSKRLMKGKGTRFPVLYNFESEDELDQTEHDIFAAEDTDKALIAARRKYSAFWGAVKYEQKQSHLNHSEICQPTTQHDWSCGMCKCGKGMTMFCMCDEGKKMLSPTRIVFQNSRVAWLVRNVIYEIGTGLYVPKSQPEVSPDWRSYGWTI